MPSSRSKTKPKSSFHTEFEAIGTHWQITLEGAQSPAQFTEVQAELHELIDNFDRHYSRFRDDSLVSEMSRRAGTYSLPNDAQPLFDVYQQLYSATDGVMTPLIGQVLSDAGYDANYSFQSRELRRPPTWETALEYNFPILVVKQPVLLDLGAAGKGYLVDLLADLLLGNGIREFVINAGGDVLQRTTGGEPLEVGLEHPDNAVMAIGVATINNQSICGSAGNRRAWRGFHHIIDPFKLASPRHIRALWVVADSTLLADALTTALFFVQPEVLRKQYDFEYAIVNDDYSLNHSPNFPATFFT